MPFVIFNFRVTNGDFLQRIFVSNFGPVRRPPLARRQAVIGHSTPKPAHPLARMLWLKPWTWRQRMLKCEGTLILDRRFLYTCLNSSNNSSPFARLSCKFLKPPLPSFATLCQFSPSMLIDIISFFIVTVVSYSPLVWFSASLWPMHVAYLPRKDTNCIF